MHISLPSSLSPPLPPPTLPQWPLPETGVLGRCCFAVARLKVCVQQISCPERGPLVSKQPCISHTWTFFPLLLLQLLRTSLVSNKQLSDICQTLGFDKFLITSKTEVGGCDRDGHYLESVFSPCHTENRGVYQNNGRPGGVFPRCSLPGPGHREDRAVPGTAPLPQTTSEWSVMGVSGGE